jgi:hypothetical protein
MAANLRNKLRAVAVAVACLGLALQVPAAVAAPSNPRPPRGSAILSGVVYGHTGSPIAGATVALYGPAVSPYNASDATPVATALTSATGAYSIAAPLGAYRVGAVPADLAGDSFGYRVTDDAVTGWLGYASNITLGTAGRAGVNLRLTAPGTIQGTVYEVPAYPVSQPPPTTEPLAGMLVRAVSGNQVQPVAPQALTAADGTFAIRGLPTSAPDPDPGTDLNEGVTFGLVISDPEGWHNGLIWWHTLVDSSFGFLLPDADLSQATAQVQDAWLRPTSRIVGVVSTSKGKPIAGATIEHATAFPWPPVTTNSQGWYSITTGFDTYAPGADPSRGYSQAFLRFSDPGGVYRTTWSGGVPFAHQAAPVGTWTDPVDTEYRVDMILPAKPATVTGVVRYESGRPAVGGWVTAYEPGHSDPNTDWGAGAPSGGGLIRSDGTFTITGLWPNGTALTPGYYVLWAMDGDAQQSLAATLIVGVNNVGTLVLPDQS